MSRYYKRAQNIGWFVLEVDTTIAGTTGVGNFQLITAGTRNFNVVWGDGTMDRNVTANITHNYPAAGIYKVAVVGVLPRVFYNNAGDRLKVKKILSFGDIVWGSFSQSFWGCGITDINGVIANGQGVGTFRAAFRETQLTTIPAGLFDNCPLVTNFLECFRLNQISTIPQGLFDNCPLVTTFEGAFNGNQIDTIPQGLFDNCPLVTDFERTFRLNGSIPNCPSDLFANNPLANNFTDCFLLSTLTTATYSDMLVSLDANNANTNVPFHGGNSKYNSIGYIGRHNLITNKTWTITDGGVDTSVVFRLEIDTTIAGTTGVGNFELRGAGTRQYTVDWGDGNVSTGLTGDVTHTYAVAGIYTISVAGLFPRVAYLNAGDKDKVKKILSFGDIVWGDFLGAFWGCGITDINNVIANGQGVNSFLSGFRSNNIINIPAGLFDNCPNVTTFRLCFFTNQINTIPAGLFDNCTLVTNFDSTFRNNGLIPNCPSDLFENNPLAEDFTQCFIGSTLTTQTYSDMLVSLDQNNQNLNVPFHGGSSTYTGAAAIAARANLVNVKGWNIIDGGQV